MTKSEILIVDSVSGEVSILFETDRLIEAPNWTPDGAHLIVNGDGGLFRISLATPSLEPIDTGFATRCNNDHGLSPDGSMLAISDHVEFNESAIYTVPVGGGEPKRITSASPSYWHGWSPDGEELVYAARRDELFDVYVVPATGGEETCLTSGFAHCDGPDYSPDGQWIWFNGEQDDRVELWRMKRDGSDLERMTDDLAVNWFPHPSPDGENVIYVAFPPGTEGHPRNKDVEIRMLSAKGGSTRKLLALHGGQGTMNVPNWSPDSRHFACVRYARP